MSESAKKPLVIFTYLVLIMSTAAVYWQAGNFDFTNYDDDKYVAENPHVTNGLTRQSIIWAFTTAHAYNWHPVTWLSLMLDCQLFGTNAGWMHLVNVLFHLANTLLLFALLKKMTGSLWPSAFVAAAFALHPMHVESVAWIAERKDVLSTFFLLLTLAAYASYVKRPTVFRFMASLALFAFGLMAKPMLVTLPFLLLLLDYWPLNRFDTQGRKQAAGMTPQRIAVEKIPFIVLSAISCVITFLVQQTGGAAININPLKERVANAFLSYAKYIGQALVPHDLAVFYPFRVGGVPLWQAAACVLLLLVISVLVIRFGRRRKYLPVGWFWFVATLVPVIGFVQVGSQALADRYTYIPYIGLFIMIAWGLPEVLSKWQYRKLTLGLSMAAVLTTMGVYAHKQTSYWNNNFTLFSHALEVTHDNYLAYNNRGGAYVRLGRWQEAIKDLTEVIRIKPDYAEAHTNLGIAYDKLGRLQEAIDAHRQAIKLRPDFVEAINNLAWLIATGPDIKDRQTNEAVRLARRACELSKYEDPAVLDTLGAAYAAAGRFKEAVDTTNKALNLAGAANQLQLKGVIQQHLSLYTQGKPYIEPAPELNGGPK